MIFEDKSTLYMFKQILSSNPIQVIETKAQKGFTTIKVAVIINIYSPCRIRIPVTCYIAHDVVGLHQH